MTQQEINEGNKLIAEFMGAKLRGRSGERVLTLGGKTEFKYHKSWNWLMPVVDKIEELGWYVKIAGEDCTISENSKAPVIVAQSHNKKAATYLAVVEFITTKTGKMKQKIKSIEPAFSSEPHPIKASPTEYERNNPQFFPRLPYSIEKEVEWINGEWRDIYVVYNKDGHKLSRHLAESVNVEYHLPDKKEEE